MADFTLPTKTFEEAFNLYERFQKGDMFRNYVAARKRLVIPALLAFLLLSIACTAASIVFIAGARSLLMLPALIAAPFILIGSLFVQCYVFFSWLENRALARGHAALPPVPWGLSAIFLFAPLVILIIVAWKVALPLILLATSAPVLLWQLDR